MGKHSITLTVLFFLTLVSIVLLPVLSITELSPFNQKKIVQTGILLFGSFSFILFYFNYQIDKKTGKWGRLLFVVFILLVHSSILAPLPHWALLQTAWYVLLVQMVLLFAYLYQKRPVFYTQFTIYSILGLVVLYTLRIYTDYLSGIFNPQMSVWPSQHDVVFEMGGERLNPDAHLGFVHRRFFNHVQTWALPLLIFGYLYLKPKIIPGIQYLFLFLVSSWWMLVFAADARGTMVASIASVILVVILFRKRSVQFIKPYLFTAISGFTLFIILFYLPETGGEKALTRLGDSGRLSVWKFTIQQIAENPIFGLGPMHFSWVGIDPPWSTPHNLILQSISEWGIPAAFLFYLMVFFALCKFYMQSRIYVQKEVQGNSSIMRIALVASLTAACVHSLVSGIFESTVSQLIATIVIGWCIGDYFKVKGVELFQEREKMDFNSLVIIGLVLLTATFTSIKVATDTPKLEKYEKHYFSTYDSFTYYPRFWHQGMIFEYKDVKYNPNSGNNEKSNKLDN